MPVDALASYSRAKRAFERIQLFRMAQGADAEGKWLAISLENGDCDLKPYVDKAEAIRFQRREDECAYFCLTGMPTLGEVRFFLDTCETLYDQGYAMADPKTYINPESIL